MWHFRRSGCALRFGLPAVVLLLILPVALIAAERPKEEPRQQSPAVDIFAGIEDGRIEVRLIPKDSTQCRLMIKNKSDKPLSVRLPAAFAGVPVLAQWQNNNNFNQGNVPQGVGIGNQPFNGGGNQNFGPMFNLPNQQNLPGNNFFNIPPEKVGQLKLASVCLDYGKPEPRPAAQYEIKPLVSYTEKPGVAEICAMLGRGQISQRVAQLAAWHLNNDVSWKKLTGLRRKLTLGTEPTYSRKELDAGKEAAEKAVEAAEKAQQSKSAEETSSSKAN